MPPKFLENIVIMCFERRCSKQNRVIRLKSSISPPTNFWAGYPTAVIRSSDVNNAVYCIAVAYSSFTKIHVVKQVVCTDVKVRAEPTVPGSIDK